MNQIIVTLLIVAISFISGHLGARAVIDKNWYLFRAIVIQYVLFLAFLIADSFEHIKMIKINQ